MDAVGLSGTDVLRELIQFSFFGESHWSGFDSSLSPTPEQEVANHGLAVIINNVRQINLWIISAQGGSLPSRLLTRKTVQHTVNIVCFNPKHQKNNKTPSTWTLDTKLSLLLLFLTHLSPT